MNSENDKRSCTNTHRKHCPKNCFPKKCQLRVGTFIHIKLCLFMTTKIDFFSRLKVISSHILKKENIFFLSFFSKTSNAFSVVFFSHKNGNAFSKNGNIVSYPFFFRKMVNFDKRSKKKQGEIKGKLCKYICFRKVRIGFVCCSPRR